MRECDGWHLKLRDGDSYTTPNTLNPQKDEMAGT